MIWNITLLESQFAKWITAIKMMGKSITSGGIFNDYVELPEGKNRDAKSL